MAAWRDLNANSRGEGYRPIRRTATIADLHCTRSMCLPVSSNRDVGVRKSYYYRFVQCLYIRYCTYLCSVSFAQVWNVIALKSEPMLWILSYSSPFSDCKLNMPSSSWSSYRATFISLKGRILCSTLSVCSSVRLSVTVHLSVACIRFLEIWKP